MDGKKHSPIAALFISVSAIIMLTAYSLLSIFVMTFTHESWYLPICLAILGLTLVISRRISSGVILAMLLLVLYTLSSVRGTVSSILFYITAIDFRSFFIKYLPSFLHFAASMLLFALAISAVYHTRFVRLWYIPAALSAILLIHSLFFGGSMDGDIFAAAQKLSDLIAFTSDEIAAELDFVSSSAQSGLLQKYGMSFFLLASAKLPFVSSLASAAAHIMSVAFVCAQYIGYILLARWLGTCHVIAPENFHIPTLCAPMASVALLIYSVTQITANIIGEWLYRPLYESSYYLPLAVLCIGLMLCLHPKPSSLLTVSLAVLLAWVYQSVNGPMRADRASAYESISAAYFHLALIICLIICAFFAVLPINLKPPSILWLIPSAIAVIYAALTLAGDISDTAEAITEAVGYGAKSLASELEAIISHHAIEISRNIENRYFLDFEYITSQSGIISVWVGVLVNVMTVVADTARAVGYILLARWLCTQK